MSQIIRNTIILIIATCIFIPMRTSAHEISAPTTSAQMVKAANTFLSALSPGQQKAVKMSFGDDERFNWHYVPRHRVGLALKEMTESQRRLAMQLLRVGLSQSGYLKATNIIALEAVLREIETWNWMGRDPDKYFFSFFGQPSKSGTWGWRMEGHHLSLNFTIVKGHLLATAPRFLGANPATVPHGDLRGLRPLSKEETLARELIGSLDLKQQRKAVFRNRAYRDIVTGSEVTVAPLKLVGISAKELNRSQLDLLVSLIDEYVTVMPPEIARQRMDAINRGELVDTYFGWAGGLKPGQPHYYRIQGPAFLIEYDNVQNNANHIHTVWRDFTNDFGRDLLREHYLDAHQ